MEHVAVPLQHPLQVAMAHVVANVLELVLDHLSQMLLAPVALLHQFLVIMVTLPALVALECQLRHPLQVAMAHVVANVLELVLDHLSH